MDIDVSFFGALKRVAGSRTRTFRLPEGATTVSDLRRAVVEELPELAPYMEHTAVGVGNELLANDSQLFPGAAVALLPPVSGGGGTPRILEGPLSLSELIEATGGVDDGALVVFSGNVRASEDGRALSGLDYDVHRDMADAVIRGIEADLMQRDGVLACRIVHRAGFVPVGESSVYVVVRAKHRPEGFEAAKEGIDRVKREAPIWKEDVFVDGARSPHLGDDATPLARASERAGDRLARGGERGEDRA